MLLATEAMLMMEPPPPHWLARFAMAGMAVGGWLGGAIFDLTLSYRTAFQAALAFNLLNLLVWVAFIPAIAAMARTMVPGHRESGAALSVGVRRMLANSPDDALRESEGQLANLKNLVEPDIRQ